MEQRVVADQPHILNPASGRGCVRKSQWNLSERECSFLFALTKLFSLSQVWRNGWAALAEIFLRQHRPWTDTQPKLSAHTTALVNVISSFKQDLIRGSGRLSYQHSSLCLSLYSPCLSCQVGGFTGRWGGATCTLRKLSYLALLFVLWQRQHCERTEDIQQDGLWNGQRTPKCSLSSHLSCCC